VIVTYDQPKWIALVLRPTADAPPDMPPGEVTVDVPLHPRSRPANIDERWQMGFPGASYVRAADPVNFEVQLDLNALQAWFRQVLVSPDYTVDLIVGRTRKGELVDHWTVLNVQSARMPNVTMQMTLNPRDSTWTTVTYRAEQHWVPDRDPASFLPTTVRHVEVEYTLLNAPQRTVRRVITDPRDIGRLVEQINLCPRDVRVTTFGRNMDRWADLRFVTEDLVTIPVYVDPAHDIIQVGEFPALAGTIWSLLTAIAPYD
jgi:hypothetical protein